MKTIEINLLTHRDCTTTAAAALRGRGIGQIHGNYDYGLLGSVSMVSATIYGFSGLIYSSPTEPFSAQARPKQALHVTSIWGEPERAPHKRYSHARILYGTSVTRNYILSYLYGHKRKTFYCAFSCLDTSRIYAVLI